jgi:transposase
VRASEQDPGARLRWTQLIASICARSVVFVDECGTNLALTPLYSYAPKGERAGAEAPKNRGKNTTLIGALSCRGIETALTIEGAADGAVFEVFVEHYLCPVLEPGTIVVWDNLSTHKSKRVRELIEEAGCWVVFLPTYSPDFNPIELAWSKVKQCLRAIGARTRQALEEAIAQALDTITSQDAIHWFQHCGCHLT